MTDVARRLVESGIVPEGNVASFLQCLRQRDFAWVVTDPSYREARLQGDIFRDIPFAIANRSGEIAQRPMFVMVLNSACDLEPGRSEVLTFAPVQSFDRFVRIVEGKDVEKARSFIESVRSNEVDHLMYLPQCPQLPEGAVVYLYAMGPLLGAEYDHAVEDGRRIASLTDNGYYFLLMKLARFFVREQR